MPSTCDSDPELESLSQQSFAALPLRLGVPTHSARLEREPSRSAYVVSAPYGDGWNLRRFERRGGETDGPASAAEDAAGAGAEPKGFGVVMEV